MTVASPIETVYYKVADKTIHFPTDPNPNNPDDKVTVTGLFVIYLILALNGCMHKII